MSEDWLLCLCYQACGIEITPHAARAMLMAILSDTRNLTYNVTDQDREAFETLLPIAGIEDTDELVRECYSEYDSGEYVIFRPATTRKLKIVPPLTETLKKRSREEKNKSGTE